ncbi:hypothetical protein F5876DRAFT_70987 [Lentinula aff. lateritia]|uniref:Uncharacterized protein n=1 Tax=Lentinula aff. lateritia TaxID=2804960 RepID=A0ACC1TH10_9AGAR|nr:hypothetical protein F5876DRAFT_70987 [Lentinula aff. lateritia]
MPFQRDVKGKGRETTDGYTDSGAIVIIGSTGADSIPSPPPLNLSTGTPSPPRPISYSLPSAPLGTSPSLAPPALNPPSSIPPIPPNSPPRLVYPDQQSLRSKRRLSGSGSSSDSLGSDLSDAVSISSYETGREVADDLEDGDGQVSESLENTRLYVVEDGSDETEMEIDRHAKLFQFDAASSEWKERGTGDVRLPVHKETKKVAAEYSETPPTLETLAIRFANSENAPKFKKEFEAAQKTNAALRGSAPAEASLMKEKKDEVEKEEKEDKDENKDETKDDKKEEKK